MADNVNINFSFANHLKLSSTRYKFSNSNNNELLIINLATVPADEFQVPVLRQAPTSLQRTLRTIDI